MPTYIALLIKLHFIDIFIFVYFVFVLFQSKSYIVGNNSNLDIELNV